MTSKVSLQTEHNVIFLPFALCTFGCCHHSIVGARIPFCLCNIHLSSPELLVQTPQWINTYFSHHSICGFIYTVSCTDSECNIQVTAYWVEICSGRYVVVSHFKENSVKECMYLSCLHIRTIRVSPARVYTLYI